MTPSNDPSSTQLNQVALTDSSTQNWANFLSRQGQPQAFSNSIPLTSQTPFLSAAINSRPSAIGGMFSQLPVRGTENAQTQSQSLIANPAPSQRAFGAPVNHHPEATTTDQALNCMAKNLAGSFSTIPNIASANVDLLTGRATFTYHLPEQETVEEVPTTLRELSSTERRLVDMERHRNRVIKLPDAERRLELCKVEEERYLAARSQKATQAAEVYRKEEQRHRENSERQKRILEERRRVDRDNRAQKLRIKADRARADQARRDSRAKGQALKLLGPDSSSGIRKPPHQDAGRLKTANPVHETSGKSCPNPANTTHVLPHGLQGAASAIKKSIIDPRPTLLTHPKSFDPHVPQTGAPVHNFGSGKDPMTQIQRVLSDMKPTTQHSNDKRAPRSHTVATTKDFHDDIIELTDGTAWKAAHLPPTLIKLEEPDEPTVVHAASGLFGEVISAAEQDTPKPEIDKLTMDASAGLHPDRVRMLCSEGMDSPCAKVVLNADEITLDIEALIQSRGEDAGLQVQQGLLVQSEDRMDTTG